MWHLTSALWCTRCQQHNIKVLLCWVVHRALLPHSTYPKQCGHSEVTELSALARPKGQRRQNILSLDHSAQLFLLFSALLVKGVRC